MTATGCVSDGKRVSVLAVQDHMGVRNKSVLVVAAGLARLNMVK